MPHRGDFVRITKRIRKLETLDAAIDALIDFVTPDPDPFDSLKKPVFFTGPYASKVITRERALAFIEEVRQRVRRTPDHASYRCCE